MSGLMRFLPLLLLISCASVQSNPIVNSEKQAYKLTCSEFNSSLEECKAKAGELCNNNFKVLEHHKETFPDAGDGIYVHAKHHLSVECKS